MIQPGDLVGSKTDDPADVLACIDERFFTLPPGVAAYDWGSPGRKIANPPSVENGPFTETRLARTPGAAWAGEILRRVASSEQPIWQILKDVRKYPLYRIDAPGVRIKDRHSDSMMVGGPLALRKEGEEAEIHEEDRTFATLGAIAATPEAQGLESGTSMEWRALDKYFREPIVAVLLPDDSPHPTLRLDWPVVASIPRLEVLVEDGFLSLVYVGSHRMKICDLLRLRDATGKPAGARFVYFLAREFAHDFFSPRRKRSVRDWITLGATVLTSVAGIVGGVSRLLDFLA